jgi:hypothetical protein
MHRYLQQRAAYQASKGLQVRTPLQRLPRLVQLMGQAFVLEFPVARRATSRLSQTCHGAVVARTAAVVVAAVACTQQC